MDFQNGVDFGGWKMVGKNILSHCV